MRQLVKLWTAVIARCSTVLISPFIIPEYIFFIRIWINLLNEKEDL